MILKIGLTIELSDFSAALELPEIGGFSAAKLEKHEITTDDLTAREM